MISRSGGADQGIKGGRMLAEGVGKAHPPWCVKRNPPRAYLVPAVVCFLSAVFVYRCDVFRL